jgi:O-antigen/teichoic acid export membrane protein
MHRFAKISRYLLSFGLARGTLFAAPILLANLLPAADYGVLEFSYAIASLFAVVIGLGTAATVPSVLINKAGTATWSGVLFHHVISVIALCMIAIVSWLAGFQPLVWITTIGIAIMMLQGLWSVTLKSQGRADASLVLDSGFWSVLALTALAIHAVDVRNSLLNRSLIAAAIIYLLVLLGCTVWKYFFSGLKPIFRVHAGTLHAGIPLLIMGLLATLATTSGRLGMGVLATPELTGSYAMLFRSTAIPIIAHQIILVASFRDLFQMPEPEMKSRLMVVTVGVVLGVIAFWVLSEPLGLLLGPAFVNAYSEYRWEGLLILIQCILWSAIALNDLVNTRRLTSGKVTGWGIGYFLVALPLAWIYLSGKTVTLSLFVPVHSAIMAGYFLVQVTVMWSCGIRLLSFWLLVFSSFSVLSLMAVA